MTNQPYLFPPAQSHGATSRSASAQIVGDAVTLRAAVMGHIEDCGRLGATDEEIQRALRMNPSTQRPRRVELVQAGLVVDSGKTRTTASGRKAVVWVMS